MAGDVLQNLSLKLARYISNNMQGVSIYMFTMHLDIFSLKNERNPGKSLVWEEKIVGAATIVADSRV